MNEILCGDNREEMLFIPSKSVQCVVTSPPYWSLRKYLEDDPREFGLEKTPVEYVQNLVEILAGIYRILKDDGVMWLNLGDSFYHSGSSGEQGKTGQRANRTFTASCAGKTAEKCEPHLQKQLVGIPWRSAFALQDWGWRLRQCIIWAKPNTMPESVKDRCTTSHEYVFLFVKSEKYFWDSSAMQEDGVIPKGTKAAKGSSSRTEVEGVNSRPAEYWEYTGKRNRRSVWTVNTKPFKSSSGQHFATYPMALIEPMILAGSRFGDVVFDPFMGAGTTACAAKKHGRKYLGCELNPAYVKMAEERISQEKIILEEWML